MDTSAIFGLAAEHREMSVLFACVWHTDYADIGDEFKLKPYISFLPFFAGFSIARRLVRRGRKGLIAFAASSAPANADLHSSFAEVLQKHLQIGIVNKRSGRNFVL